MHLAIYSLQSTLFEGEVRQTSIPTPMGEITILDNHLPLISLVNPGQIRYVDLENKETTLRLAGGVAEIRPGSEVVILANEEEL